MFRVPLRHWFRAQTYVGRGAWSTRAVHVEEQSDQGQRPALRLKVHDTNVYSSGQLAYKGYEESG